MSLIKRINLFRGVVNKINSWVSKNTKSHKRKQVNVWECVLYRTDMNIDIKLDILAFDLFVDKTQFQDRRI